jgi:hypothetical protein
LIAGLSTNSVFVPGAGVRSGENGSGIGKRCEYRYDATKQSRFIESTKILHLIFWF